MSSTNFADKLHSSMLEKNSRVVVGLDPVYEHLPAPIREAAEAQYEMEHRVTTSHIWAIREFLEQIIETTKDVAVAFKPQIAFFERYGHAGIELLERTVKAHEDCIFIIDCKRGDIGSTSSAYAQAYFNLPDQPVAPLACDAVTHNAFLGRDTLEPYFPYLQAGKGMFVLAKTSNPSASDFQDLLVDGEPLHLRIARKVEEWGSSCVGACGFSALGLVVGATQPESAVAIRQAAPHALILVPGMQTQGGKLEDARVFCDAQGKGAIFNFSRSVIYAHKFGQLDKGFSDDEYAQAARTAAEHNRMELNEVLGDVH